MSNNENLLNPERLLEHTDWMKALARSLVVDVDLADDVVQQAWLAAVKTPPRTPEATRSWLRKVLRNFAYRARKQEHDRRRRERFVAKPEEVSGRPEDLVERAELHREIVDMVLQLGEPHRSTILLRFFEGLTAGEIARRYDIPVTTVRSRLTNALARLRRRLDRRSGGDRQAWRVALAPLAGLDRISSLEAMSSSMGPGSQSAVTTASTTSSGSTVSSSALSNWIGAIVMTKKVALSVAAAVAITTGVGIGIGHFTASSRTRHAEELSRLQQELLDARSRLDRLTQELDEERARAAREGEPRVAVKGQVTAGKKDEVGPEAVGEQSASSYSPIAFGELALSEFSAADWLRIAGDFQRAQSFLLEMQELQRQGKEPEAAFKEGVMREVLKYLQFNLRLMGKLPTTSPETGVASHPLPQINLKAAMLELSGLPMTIDQKRAVARLGEAYGW